MNPFEFEFDVSAHVTFDPIVVERIDLFCLYCKRMAGSPPDEQRKIAESLCELSRDIRFYLGSAVDAPHDLVRGIILLFRSAAQIIVPAPGDRLYKKYQEHVGRRADELEKELKAPQPHFV